jgi:hypothetical protein
MPPLRIAQNNAADEPLARDPLALVLGMMLAPAVPDGVPPPAIEVAHQMRVGGPVRQ